MNCYTKNTKQPVIDILLLTKSELSNWLKKQPKRNQAWVASNQFVAKSGSHCCLPDASGKITKILVGINGADDFWAAGDLPRKLPKGVYQFVAFENKQDPIDLSLFVLSWGLGAYQFDHYKKHVKLEAKLLLPKSNNISEIVNTVESIYLVRDLINIPPHDMHPEGLANSAKELAAKYGAKFKTIIGKDLEKQNYPMIYAVGKASACAPRLIDFTWGDPKAKKVTLVGKGVCFDTGGLDLKPLAGMSLMKKDMGGAAHALGLANLIMSENLPVRLRVLIPAVENSISSEAYRPSDVLNSRKGDTVEIYSTDAEGRLVVADALTEAVSEKPDHLIDFTTLTGAARVALGRDVPAMFSNNEAMAAGLEAASGETADPLWRLPLYQPYKTALKSDVADLVNCGKDGFGGAITAALFLQNFVPDNIAWTHFDLMAWNQGSRPGRPVGGEAMALRAVFDFLKTKCR